MIVKPYFTDFAGIEFGKKDHPVLCPGVKESMTCLISNTYFCSFSEFVEILKGILGIL